MHKIGWVMGCGMILVALGGLGPSWAWAEPIKDVSGKILDQIEVQGLKRTKKFVVLRELTLKVGSAIVKEDWTESLQRIWNLDLFSQVDFDLQKNSSGEKATLLIRVVEKWTTIPIFDFGSSGGTDYITLGVADPNIFGRFLTLGLQYTQFEGRHSGALWFINPRLDDQRLQLALTVQFLNRRRSLYTPDRELEGAYTRKGPRISLGIEKEIHPFLRWGLGVSATSSNLSDDDLSAIQLAANSNNGIAIPADDFNITLSAHVSFGRVNLRNYLLTGGSTQISIERADDLWGSDTVFSAIELKNRYFWLLSPKLNLAWRFDAGFRNADELQHQFYLGGLNDVRGFLDGQFRNKAYFRNNLELRYLLLEWDWLVLQPVVFADLGRVAAQVGTLMTGSDRVFGSVGIGGRAICPKIYSCVGRLDFAQGMGPGGEKQISIAVGQFF